MSADTTSPAPSSVPPPPAQKKGMSTGCIVTLVIGLVLVLGAIVMGGLAVLGIFGGRSVMAKARDLQAKATMKGLEIAITSYVIEYNHLPISSNPAPPNDGEARDTSDESGKVILAVLLADDDTQNPRKIRFWDPPPAKSAGAGYSNSTGLIDPWGKGGYRILLDDNGDGTIPDPENLLGNLSGSVLIYSAGADGDFSTWHDNVCSWK